MLIGGYALFGVEVKTLKRLLGSGNDHFCISFVRVASGKLRLRCSSTAELVHYIEEFS